MASTATPTAITTNKNHAFFRTKMPLFSFSSFWVTISSLLLTLFRFFPKFFHRYIKNDSTQMNNSSKAEYQIGSSLIEPEKDEDLDDSLEDSKPHFGFTFKFPTYEEFSKSHGDFASSSGNQFCSEEPEVKVFSNKYDFVSGENLSFFVEEAKVSNFFIKELFADSNGDSSLKLGEVIDSGFLSENDFGKQEEVNVIKEDSSNSGKVDSENDRENNSQKVQEINEEKGEKFLSESNYMCSDSDSDSITSSHEFSFMSQFIDSTTDSFLSDMDFEIEGGNFESKNGELDFNDDDDDEDEDILGELRKLVESQTEELGAKQGNVEDNSENGSINDNGNEDSNGLESLWEHQELVEQLKMELRKVKATGLPTILEESESPKITEDLKPWKMIDEKFNHGDKLNELHKFYKSYRERMRKLDILNYQKMYALGFLQSKDPLHSLWSPKSSTFWRHKRKKPHSDQMVKFIRELQTGQSAKKLCLGDAVAGGIVNNETLGYFIGRVYLFLTRLGINEDRLRFRQHLANEMAHYACDCWDAEIECSYGWIECVGIADRSAFDLRAHSEKSGVPLVAAEKFSEPREVEELIITPVKKELGLVFKGQQKNVVEALEAMKEEEALEMKANLETKGEMEFYVCTLEKNVSIKKSMVAISKQKKKVHQRVFTPSVIEPSFGIGRIIYCLYEHSFYTRPSKAGDDQLNVFRFPPLVAPIKCTVFPLVQNEKYEKVAKDISKSLTVAGISHKIDITGTSIGKRYARTDELGVPFAVTVDSTTSVTIRERDSKDQIRVNVEDAASVVKDVSEGLRTWTEVWASFPHHSSASADD